MISSGKLADIVHYQREGLVYYGMKGAFIPLNDLIENYAPNDILEGKTQLVYH